MEPKKPAGDSFFRRPSDASERPAAHEEHSSESESGVRERPPYRKSSTGRPERSERSSRPPYGSHKPSDRRTGGAGGKAYGKAKTAIKQIGMSPARKKEWEEKVPENVIFGIHPVREAIEGGTEIEKIYFRKSAGERLDPDERAGISALNNLRQQAQEAGLHLQEVPIEKLNRLAHNGNHQGVVAVVSAIEYTDLNDLVETLEAAIAAGESPLLVVLDSVTDVRNFGAIARSAECAGASAIVMSAKNSAPVNGEAIRASAGALGIIPICRAGSLKIALGRLKEAGIQCVAATEKAERLLYEIDLKTPTAIVMGSEDRGISRDILSLCDSQAGIPLVGRIESLNVSAAAAVILFEARRQRFESQYPPQ